MKAATPGSGFGNPMFVLSAPKKEREAVKTQSNMRMPYQKQEVKKEDLIVEKYPHSNYNIRTKMS